MNHRTTLRVARPTDHLDEVVRFYVDGLGLNELGRFEDHEGFDGVMVGVPGAPYHLEFSNLLFGYEVVANRRARPTLTLAFRVMEAL